MEVQLRSRDEHSIILGSSPLPTFVTACWQSTKTSLAVTILVLLGVGSTSFCQSQAVFEARFQPENLTEEQLIYRVISGNVAIGELITSIVHDAGGVITLNETTTGLYTQTTMIVVRDDATLQPLRSATTIPSEVRDQLVKVRYDYPQVRGHLDVPVAFGGTREVRTKLQDIRQDWYLIPYLLRASQLALRNYFAFPVYHPLTDSKIMARGWVMRIENVQVPAGEFECFRIDGYSGRQRWIIYLQTAFPQRLIKRVLPGLGVEYQLFSVQRR